MTPTSDITANSKTYRIKPLEWKSIVRRGITVNCPVSDGWYTVYQTGDLFYWRWRYTSDKKCNSIAHGKELAEAHYRARLLPALEEVTDEKAIHR